MRPKTITVTSGNSPYYIPVNWRGDSLGVTATPNGAGNYDVAYTRELPSSYDFASDASAWVDVSNMSAATAVQSEEIPVGATCLRITLNSGTNVVVDLSQQDV